jgi:hypothetical protein
MQVMKSLLDLDKCVPKILDGMHENQSASEPQLISQSRSSLGMVLWSASRSRDSNEDLRNFCKLLISVDWEIWLSSSRF